MGTSNLSIGELEAKYPLYCKALKMLIKQGKKVLNLSEHSVGIVCACCIDPCQGNTNLLSD